MKRACELIPGDIVTQLPYPNGEAMPITVVHVYLARRRGYMVLYGTDANGAGVTASLGYRDTRVGVQ